MEQIQEVPARVQIWVDAFLSGILAFGSLEQLKLEVEDLETTLVSLHVLDQYSTDIHSAYLTYKHSIES